VVSPQVKQVNDFNSLQRGGGQKAALRPLSFLTRGLYIETASPLATRADLCTGDADSCDARVDEYSFDLWLLRGCANDEQMTWSPNLWVDIEAVGPYHHRRRHLFALDARQLRF
jgi:hypothetical protein